MRALLIWDAQNPSAETAVDAENGGVDLRLELWRSGILQCDSSLIVSYRKGSSGADENAWEPGSQANLIASIKPDLIIFSPSWRHIDGDLQPTIPMVIDIVRPELREGTRPDDSSGDAPELTDRKLRMLAAASGIVCSSREDRQYLSGWLLQAGRVPESGHFVRVSNSASEISEAFLAARAALPSAEPILGHVAGRPAALSVRGESAILEVGPSRPKVRCAVTMPADEISAVSVPLAASQPWRGTVEVKLLRAGGACIAEKQFALDGQPLPAELLVPIHPFRGVKGGSEVVCEISLIGATPSQELLPLQAVRSAAFPLLESYGNYDRASFSFIALRFLSGPETKFHRWKAQLRRAVILARNGDWKRIRRALETRLNRLRG